MTSRLDLIIGLLAIALLTLSGCVEATPTLDPTATNPPAPTSAPTEISTSTAEPTATPTPIPPPVIDLDFDAQFIQGIDNVPANALARIGISYRDVNFVPFPDSSGIILLSTTGVYAYRLPGFDPMWRQYLNPSPHQITFSEDGKLTIAYRTLVDGCQTEAVVFDTETGQLVEQYFPEVILSSERSGSISVVQREPEVGDGRFIPVVEVYDGDEYLGRLDISPVFSRSYSGVMVTLSPGGDHVATSIGTPILHVWSIPSLEPLYSINYSDDNQGSLHGYNSLFSDDGEYLTYFDEGRLNVALAETGEVVHQFEDTVSKYLWLPHTLVLFYEDTFRIMSPDNWSEIPFEAENRYFSLSPDEELFAIKTEYGVSVFDTDSLELEYTIPFAQQDGGYVEWLDDDRWLTLIESTNTTLINRETGEPVFVLPDASLRLIDDKNAYLTIDNHLLVVDLNQGEATGGVIYAIMPQSLQWAVDEDALIIEGELETWLWSEATNELHPIESPPDAYPGIKDIRCSFPAPDVRYPSPDGQIEVFVINDGLCGDGPCSGGCGYESSVLQFFQGDSEQPFAEYPFEDGITAMAWSPDGELLALGHQGFGDSLHEALWADRISIIDPTNGQVLQTFEGHTGGISGLLFSPDGLRLASTSDDGTIIIWALGDD